jgi:hypothetical protein
MLRRITYTVGWLTMAVPTQVRGCANVGALTALDVPAQSERRSAKIEASPQMDSLVWSEIQMDRSSAHLTAPQRQPTDGAMADRRQRFQPGERSPKSNKYHCGHCGFRSPYEGKVQDHWVEKHGMSTEEAARVMTAQNPDLSLDKLARRGPKPKRKPGEYNAKFKVYQCGHCSRQSTSERLIRDHWVEKHGMSSEKAASVMMAQNPDLILDKPSRQFKFKPGEYNPKSKRYHCGHCRRRSSSEQVIRNHWVAKHGMASDDAARVMTAQNPDVSLDKRARRGAQFKYKPGNPKSILYHCGHCSRQSTSEQVIRNHWVEKHGMSTEEAARVMMAQNPDLSLDTPARRGPQPKRKPGEYDPKFKLYHCGHCCRQSTSEQVIRNHWVERHEMSTEEAASVMAAQNPDLILDTPVRRGAQFKFKPGERNPRNTWYHCGYCAFSWSNALTVCKHWVEKHGMSTDEAVSVMTAQNPDVSLDKRARRGPQPKHKPGEYNPKFKLYRCGHCSRQSSSERSIRNHWVEKHGMAAEEAARVMAAQNPSPST